jgi:hypothetical protein
MLRVHATASDGTRARQKCFPLMADREFISRLVEEIEQLKRRVAEQIVTVERRAGDDLREEKATLRNLVMRLDGLKLMLLKSQQQAFGG